ncbi:hypothetical protein [Streptomyces sp. NBC_00470]|uniref:hypothetical protein n=1 Tax=Streptomyces sp. NBC_00470 TaxID=2975753 RepID=UPI0030E2F1AB
MCEDHTYPGEDPLKHVTSAMCWCRPRLVDTHDCESAPLGRGMTYEHHPSIALATMMRQFAQLEDFPELTADGIPAQEDAEGHS